MRLIVAALVLTFGAATHASAGQANFQPLTSQDIKENIASGAGCSYVDNKGTVYAYADTQYLLVKTEAGASVMAPVDPNQHVFFASSDMREMAYAASTDKKMNPIMRVTQWGYDQLVDIEFLAPATPAWIGGLHAECDAP